MGTRVNGNALNVKCESYDSTRLYEQLQKVSEGILNRA